ncbi:hexosaminidase [Dysgonomonas hofstadii]|uniref:beta-N-acetylhexosaminidase n=2 Tax=Dysgonomonas hofstadii TaxID=637886 RepID=A0A840CPF6_9BACT|nr:hexosaminidase [Dysgonomonas hofstadii]
MFKRFCYFLTLTFLAACSSNNDYSVVDYNIVPMVQEINYVNDKSFLIDNTTKIVYPSDNKSLAGIAGLLAEYIEFSTGYRLEVSSNSEQENIISLTTNFTNDNSEAYNIEVNDSLISINGASEAGTFYGVQTLRNAIPTNASGSIEFPGIDITDYPAYKYRGVSLDVSRHFFPVSFVKKYIDVLAMCKMNVFHWHLTDDQGWRIEIKKYPKLTEIGSKREKTVIDRHTGEFDDKPHEGFYTQEEIKDIIKYAQERFITIIPEIDIPGHTLALLASYPELGCTGGPYEVGCEWGIYEDVLCAGNEDVFSFLDDVFTEITKLFPSEYIHIGGDKCLKNRWDACPKCQKRMQQLRLKENKEHTKGEQLQSYFIKRVEKIVNDKGRSVIGWDNIQESDIAPNATIMAWHGIESGTDAASKGHNVIMTPEQFTNLDYYQSPDVDNEPFTYGWLTELKKIYSFDPMPANLDENKQKHILGAQVNIWTEYMPSSQNVEYMLLPRMCALAETLWRNPRTKDYNDFVSRLYKLSPQFDKLGYDNCKYAYGIQDSIFIDTIRNEICIYLSTFDNSPIYYTMGEKDPTTESTLYNVNEPIIIKENTLFKAVVYRDNIKSDVYSKDFIYHKACAHPIKLKNEPDNKYTFKGAESLVSGQIGSVASYRTGLWIGFLGTDLDATIDLKEETGVSSISFNSYVNTRGNLFDPKALYIYVSQDGKNFEEIYKEEYATRKEHIGPMILSLSANLMETVKARYVKVVAESIKTLPEWHEKSEKEAYLMIDEIRIF